MNLRQALEKSNRCEQELQEAIDRNESPEFIDELCLRHIALVKQITDMRMSRKHFMKHLERRKRKLIEKHGYTEGEKRFYRYLEGHD